MELKPGDRALVVGCEAHQFMNGQVIVLTGRFFCEWGYGRYRDWAWHFENDPDGRGIYECFLVRIPPDSEAKQMFRETSKPKEQSHA